MVVAFAEDLDKGVGNHYLFRSYDHPSIHHKVSEYTHKNPGPAHDGPIWKVARATTAAPIYFEAIEFDGKKFLDGGLGANNPSVLAFMEVDHLHRYKPELVISIGTGEKEPKKVKRKREKVEDLGKIILDDNARKQFIKKWTEIARYAKDFTTDTGESANDLAFWATKLGIKYYRFNVESDLGNMPLDDWRPSRSGDKTLDEITARTITFLETPDVDRNLQQCAELLVNKRQQRAQTERWEKFATNIKYHCDQDPCNQVPGDCDREILRQHFIDNHRQDADDHHLETRLDGCRI